MGMSAVHADNQVSRDGRIGVSAGGSVTGRRLPLAWGEKFLRVTGNKVRIMDSPASEL